MDKIRQGEIAVLVVKYAMRKQGIRFSEETIRDLGNVAKKLGIKSQELKEFFQPLVEEMVDEFFSSKS